MHSSSCFLSSTRMPDIKELCYSVIFRKKNQWCHVSAHAQNLVHLMVWWPLVLNGNLFVVPSKIVFLLQCVCYVYLKKCFWKPLIYFLFVVCNNDIISSTACAHAFEANWQDGTNTSDLTDTWSWYSVYLRRTAVTHFSTAQSILGSKTLPAQRTALLSSLALPFTAHSYRKHRHKPGGNGLIFGYISRIPKRIFPHMDLDPRAVLHIL